ncbi:unnamed protein product [Caretta caretta]
MEYEEDLARDVFFLEGSADNIHQEQKALCVAQKASTQSQSKFKRSSCKSHSFCFSGSTNIVVKFHLESLP